MKTAPSSNTHFNGLILFVTAPTALSLGKFLFIWDCAWPFLFIFIFFIHFMLQPLKTFPRAAIVWHYSGAHKKPAQSNGLCLYLDIAHVLKSARFSKNVVLLFRWKDVFQWCLALLCEDKALLSKMWKNRTKANHKKKNQSSRSLESNSSSLQANKVWLNR